MTVDFSLVFLFFISSKKIRFRDSILFSKSTQSVGTGYFQCNMHADLKYTKPEDKFKKQWEHAWG